MQTLGHSGVLKGLRLCCLHILVLNIGPVIPDENLGRSSVRMSMVLLTVLSTLTMVLVLQSVQ